MFCAKNWRLSPEAKPHLSGTPSLVFECSGSQEVKSYSGFLKRLDFPTVVDKRKAGCLWIVRGAFSGSVFMCS